MAKNNFDSKENLGHGIKGEVSSNTNSKNLKSEKSNKKNKNK